jgi:hypothetical protein
LPAGPESPAASVQRACTPVRAFVERAEAVYRLSHRYAGLALPADWEFNQGSRYVQGGGP